MQYQQNDAFACGTVSIVGILSMDQLDSQVHVKVVHQLVTRALPSCFCLEQPQRIERFVRKYKEILQRVSPTFPVPSLLPDLMDRPRSAARCDYIASSKVDYCQISQLFLGLNAPVKMGLLGKYVAVYTVYLTQSQAIKRSAGMTHVGNFLEDCDRPRAEMQATCGHTVTMSYLYFDAIIWQPR